MQEVSFSFLNLASGFFSIEDQIGFFSFYILSLLLPYLAAFTGYITFPAKQRLYCYH